MNSYDMSVERDTDFNHVIGILGKMKKGDQMHLRIVDAHGDPKVNQALADAIKQCQGDVVVMAANTVSASSLIWATAVLG